VATGATEHTATRSNAHCNNIDRPTALERSWQSEPENTLQRTAIHATTTFTVSGCRNAGGNQSHRTHCNTLQRTTPCCNALFRAATRAATCAATTLIEPWCQNTSGNRSNRIHCNALQRTPPRCNALQRALQQYLLSHGVGR